MAKFIYGEYSIEEKEAFECFKKFAEERPMSFKNYEQTPYGTFYDVTATNKYYQDVIVELKLRQYGSDNYGDCFIEEQKWHNMMRAKRIEEVRPVYMNFIGDANNVYIWQLDNIKNAKFHPNITINGEEVDRIGLDWNDAWHFVYKDNKYNLVNKGK